MHFVRVIFVAVVVLAGAVSPVVGDVLLTSGGSTFNFDTDGSGDFNLQRSNLTNVMADAQFYVRVTSDGVFRNLDNPTNAGAGSGVVFDGETGISSVNPVSGLAVTQGFVNTNASFSLSEEAFTGHAVLDYNISIEGGGIYSSTAGPTMIELWTVFDYDGNMTTERSYFEGGHFQVGDGNGPNGEGDLRIFAGESGSGVNVTVVDSGIGVFDQSTGSMSASSYAAGAVAISPGAGADLVAGHWMRFMIDADDDGSPNDFELQMSGRIGAVPEPAATTILLLVGGLAILRRRV